MCDNPIAVNDDDDDDNNNNNKTTENSHIGHCTRTSESTNVKVQ
jgi:hypothetical protein